MTDEAQLGATSAEARRLSKMVSITIESRKDGVTLTRVLHVNVIYLLYVIFRREYLYIRNEKVYICIQYGWVEKFSTGERACPARRTCSYTSETSLAEGGAKAHAVVP